MAAKPDLHCIDDFEAHARSVLPKMARDYFNGGAMDSATLAANRDAFADYFIRPRALRDVSQVHTEKAVFPGGALSPFPCAVAPAAMQKMAHPEGEEAMARACASHGVAMGLSSFSTTSMEQVKHHAETASLHPDGPELVLQLYLFENRAASEDLIKRAEALGFKAIVPTVDTPQFGRRLTEIRNSFRVPPHLRMENFSASLGVKTGSELRTEQAERKSPISQNNTTTNKNDASLTWDSVSYLKSLTRLPVWLKGIMTPEDARLAVDHGADAIFVSNHGGRQLDWAPPTLDVLPEIVEAVDGAIPIHFDGGVRRGSDIFKALCLGADIVWIGRPAIWGLAYDGERGVRRVLQLLEDEFRSCMALAGCADIRDLGPKLLRPRRSRL